MTAAARAVTPFNRLRCSTAAIAAPNKAAGGADRCSVATSFGVPSLAAAAVKATATPQMKNVPLHERTPLLSAAIQAGTDAVQGRRLLLIDDLWETGSTLRGVAEVLGHMGASEIRALVMTRTK